MIKVQNGSLFKRRTQVMISLFLLALFGLVPSFSEG